MHQQSRRRRGGALIGSGTYGCVFRPAWPCQGDATVPAGVVTKIMERSDADDEMKLAPAFAAADPGRAALVHPLRACELPPGQADRVAAAGGLDNYDRCELLRKPPTALRQVQFPDAGTSLTAALANDWFARGTAVGAQRLLRTLAALARALAALHDKGVLHLDIKEDNVACLPPPPPDAANGAPPTCRFIDIGLATTLPFDPVAHIVMGPTSSAYELYPPIANLAYVLATPGRADMGTWLQHRVAEFNRPGRGGAWRVVTKYFAPRSGVYASGMPGEHLWPDADALRSAAFNAATAAGVRTDDTQRVIDFLADRVDVWMFVLMAAKAWHDVTGFVEAGGMPAGRVAGSVTPDVARLRGVGASLLATFTDAMHMKLGAAELATALAAAAQATAAVAAVEPPATVVKRTPKRGRANVMEAPTPRLTRARAAAAAQ